MINHGLGDFLMALIGLVRQSPPIRIQVGDKDLSEATTVYGEIMQGFMTVTAEFKQAETLVENFVHAPRRSAFF
jgi:hypothetical protein